LNLEEAKIVCGAKNCALSLDTTRYLYTPFYLELLEKCLRCKIWDTSILYCAMALESYLRETLNANKRIGAYKLLKSAGNVWKKEQIKTVECVFAFRDAHVHPYGWLFGNTKNRLKNCSSIFGQTRPKWFKELSKKTGARTSKRIPILYDSKTAYAVAKQTIRLICPNLH